MTKNYFSFFYHAVLSLIVQSFFCVLFSFFTYSALAQTSYTLSPTADAFVRNGSYASTNYGSDTALIVKGSTSSGYTRKSYLKFSLGSVSTITSAKLRVYGRNTDNTAGITFSLYGIDNDSWTESGITWNNAPAAVSNTLASTAVNDQSKYYDLDVSAYVKSQFSGDKTVSFLMQDISNQNKNLLFNSKENKTNKPQLIITASATQSNALLFVENPDKFPSNDHFVFSRIQTPWTRDSVYADNHDSLRIRIHNKGISPLIVTNLVLSNSSRWKIDKIKGAAYVPATSLPLSISSGTFADVIVKFVAIDQATRVKVVYDTLTIVSNDDKLPSKNIFLTGIWQKKAEGSNEPYAQEIINAFAFKTRTGFGVTDINKGDTSLPFSGDEIRPSYFVRADNTRPVSIVQIAAYHICCSTAPAISWYTKGSNIPNTIVTHISQDGQTVMPRKSAPNTPADAVFSPTTAFGFKIGDKDYTDAAKNTGGKISIKIWKVLDAKGYVIPNSYIIANASNYDYQDNVYLVKNLRPEKGTAYFSKLSSTPSAVDFGEKLLQSANSFTLNIVSLGKSYTDGSKDPAITISSVAIAGENKSEFSASMPLKTTLNAAGKTTLFVSFKPVSQGLKIADLLIYYNNSHSPLRVPLYGIAKASGTTVTAKYRVNSGSSTSLTLNGKTWSADTVYVVGDMQPYKSKLTEIECTDEDALYVKEQHSNAAKKPWSYVFPVANGNYVVRLHFAEIFWGVPGYGLNGGAGSRVMSVALEGQLRIVNFDPTQEIGAVATALVKNIPVTVTDGKLNIDFSSTVDRPMVCAVEVYSFSTTSNKASLQSIEHNFEKAKAYPNPVRKTLKVEFPASYVGDYHLQILDALGRMYEIGKMKLPKGGSNMEVDVSRLSLKPGFYYLWIQSVDKKPELIKLVVE
ncbi:DUF7594 domain-containing protein [Segetibacter koreensis]|uniref:CBM96 family carbohydrate-binding protein n=1 Tax=Segetibacter koreensis TaxID=398037 RepID=UPI0003811DB2|nr:DNRLRE domain-containing protein [Segetibacter koreensis]